MAAEVRLRTLENGGAGAGLAQGGRAEQTRMWAVGVAAREHLLVPLGPLLLLAGRPPIAKGPPCTAANDACTNTSLLFRRRDSLCSAEIGGSDESGLPGRIFYLGRSRSLLRGLRRAWRHGGRYLLGCRLLVYLSPVCACMRTRERFLRAAGDALFSLPRAPGGNTFRALLPASL